MVPRKMGTGIDEPAGIPGADMNATTLGAVAQLGEHLLCTQEVRSSTLLSSISHNHGRVAQLGEQLVYTQHVVGSNPAPPTIYPRANSA